MIGYKNLPPYIQYFINRRFHPYKYFTTAYIDNIIVFSNIKEEYFKYLRLILEFFKNINFNIVIKKSFVTYLSIRFCDYRMTGFSLAITEEYIKGSRNLKILENLANFKKYINIGNFLKKFVL